MSNTLVAKHEWQHQKHLMLTDLKLHDPEMLRSGIQLELSPLRNHYVAVSARVGSDTGSFPYTTSHCHPPRLLFGNFSIYKVTKAAKKTDSMLGNRRGESCNTEVEGHNYPEAVLEQSPLGAYMTRSACFSSIWPWLSWHLWW